MHPGVLTDRAERARLHLRRCMLCEHRCGVDRQAGQRGKCLALTGARVHRYRVEYGEEPGLVPSLLFYLSGCDLRCSFCIAGLDAFDPRRGELLTPDLYRTALEAGLRQGARTVQWVGGEPAIHLPAILDAMAGCPTTLPLVWKTNLHATSEALDLLDGIADVYLVDYKFGDDRCAREIAKVENYTAILQRNLLHVARQGRLIVRHLLLPGHFDCCYRPMVRWLREHLPGVDVSIRDSYLPAWRALKTPDLNRTVDRASGRLARELARDHGLAVIQ